MFNYPVHRVGEIAEDQNLAPVAGVAATYSLGFGFLGYSGELVDEFGQGRVGGAGHRPGSTGEGSEQVPVP